MYVYSLKRNRCKASVFAGYMYVCMQEQQQQQQKTLEHNKSIQLSKDKQRLVTYIHMYVCVYVKYI